MASPTLSIRKTSEVGEAVFCSFTCLNVSTSNPKPHLLYNGIMSLANLGTMRPTMRHWQHRGKLRPRIALDGDPAHLA